MKTDIYNARQGFWYHGSNGVTFALFGNIIFNRCTVSSIFPSKNNLKKFAHDNTIKIKCNSTQDIYEILKGSMHTNKIKDYNVKYMVLSPILL